jgi:beta-galactosidase
MKTILHGGDYNPDQWLDRPEVLDEDFRLFGKAGVNAVSIGIFAWTRLEPEDGRFDFSWLDSIMDRLERAGIKAILATPSGAKPAWMSQKYPEILRCQANRVRDLHGGRHNHCYTSPVYREKATRINTNLAQRYAAHPALFPSAKTRSGRG